MVSSPRLSARRCIFSCSSASKGVRSRSHRLISSKEPQAMRKSASIYMLLSLLLLTALSLQAQTRPRRVGDTVSNPPKTQPTPQAQPVPKRPVLQTGTTISSSGRPTTQPQTSTAGGNVSSDPEEVGEGDVVRVS